jgi:two-component sensor histidine kinase
MSRSGPTKPIVERPPNHQRRTATDERALQARVRQQEILADLGVTALKGEPFEDLLNETVRLVVEGLGAELGKVLEYLPSKDRLVMRAGIGWQDGLVGRATVGADLASPAGFALRTGKPVISNHLESEQRFRTPDLLAAHGVRRAMNVILQGDGTPYGVLEVDSKSTGEFNEHDVAFLQGAANILGMAIERQRRERALQAAIEYQQVLVKEINHRVKNSLQLVASVLRLQMGDDPQVIRQLQEASSRIMAIGRAHDRLYRSPQVEKIELAGYLADICRDMKDIGANCDISFDASAQIFLNTDQAINVALIVTELISNAAKHAYPADTRGPIWIGLWRRDDQLAVISVRDEGVGVPADLENNNKKDRLGMRLIAALAKQADAEWRIERHARGTEFILEIPAPKMTAETDDRSPPPAN